jgi:hypothetical protein
MKKLLYALLIMLTGISFSSCNNWLSINTDPNSPSNSSVSVSERLPYIQYHYLYGWGAASVRSSLINGSMTYTYGSTSANNNLAAWNPIQSSSTTPYQQWFVGAAANLSDLISKAESENAYYYIGAAYTIRAMGFMMMADLYGEIPYTDALSSSLSPAYDDGKTIFNGCMADLDKALTYFKMTQPSTATALSAGDSWNGGDVTKWVKLIHGLKARWLLNLSKKSDLFDPDAILTELESAPQSNTESTIKSNVNSLSDVNKDYLTGDPLNTSVIYDFTGESATCPYFTLWYKNLLTNSFTGGSGVVDPRLTRLLPSAQFSIGGTKTFVTTSGVDVINSTIRNSGGPSTSTYSTTTKKWTSSHLGDTVYVGLKNLSALYGATTTESTYLATDGTVLSTGSYYTRPEGPNDILGYPEMCFIKAEVLFRKGDKSGALTAYQAGIKAHMELMNTTLSTYTTASSVNPGKQVIATSDITAFLSSAAVAQTVSDLTMAKIMQQKFIALSLNLQSWNDMRRFNYSAGNIGSYGVVYPDLDRPYEMTAAAKVKIPGTAKTDVNYWFRRFMQCSHETNYNSANLLLINPLGTDGTGIVWSIPVWWDTSTDDEYYTYIK